MNFRVTRTNVVFVGFLAIGGYFLIREHSAHVSMALPYLPYLLLLACPLLHLFLHRGHGHSHPLDHRSSGSDGGSTHRRANGKAEEEARAEHSNE